MKKFLIGDKIDIDEEYQTGVEGYYDLFVGDKGLPKDCEAYENAYEHGLLSYIDDMTQYRNIILYKGDYYKLEEIDTEKIDYKIDGIVLTIEEVISYE